MGSKRKRICADKGGLENQLDTELYMDEYAVDLPICYGEGVVPEGRGIPMDLFETGADCGPSSLAAYLNISTSEAIALLPLWKEKRRHSSKRTLDALARIGRHHRRLNLPKGIKSPGEVKDRYPCGFAEVRFLKEDGDEFSTRHAVAYDNNRFGELLIYDINAEVDGIRGSWISEGTWLHMIRSRGSRFIHSSEQVVDHYLRHVLVPVNR